VAARIRALVFRERFEAELDEELRYHLDREVERGVAAGLSPREARGAALLPARRASRIEPLGAIRTD